VVIEKTGDNDAIFDFFAYLKQYEILEFVRSGRVAVGKTEKGLVEYLPEADWAYYL